MEQGKRTRIANLFLPQGFSSLSEEIITRINRDPAFIEVHRDRMTPELRAALVAAIQDILGPSVKEIKLTFSPKAGCKMCPCSPGFSVSGVYDSSHKLNPLLSPAWNGYPSDHLTSFTLCADGTLQVNTVHEKRNWGRDARRSGRFTYTTEPVMTYLPFGKRIVKKEAA